MRAVYMGADTHTNMRIYVYMYTHLDKSRPHLAHALSAHGAVPRPRHHGAHAPAAAAAAAALAPLAPLAAYILDVEHLGGG